MMKMDVDAALRVVVAKRRKSRVGEFRLRTGEVGLSLFLRKEVPSPEVILEAVRAAGKQGELAIAELPISTLHEIGLRLIPTPGGTPSSEVNEVHVEARLKRWLRVWLWFRRIDEAEYFNERYAAQLAAAAVILD